MKTKTSELTDAALDWAVAKADGLEIDSEGPIWFGDHPQANEALRVPYRPSTTWAQGGPIIERHEFELLKWGIDGWVAKDTNYQFLNTPNERAVFVEGHGPTPLIAAMRCFVQAKLGDEVDIPEELLC